MRNLLMGVVGVVVLAVAGVAVAAAMQPADLRVERSTVVDATPADVFPHVDDLQQFVEWSPWSELDPDATYEFSTRARGVGAWYTWDGNDDIGAGKMTVVESVPGERVAHTVEFTRPFTSAAGSSIEITPEGDGTKVTWAFEMVDRSLFEKATTLFVSMDDMIGADYERGLANLAPIAEAAAEAREEAERAAEAAAAEAAAAEGDEGEG